MNRSQFEQIVRRMERHYGKIYAQQEKPYYMLMFPMEGNALKVHRKYPSSNSRRMREAIDLVLYQVESRVTQKPQDVSSFENEDNIRLRDALLYAFDPFFNQEIKDALGKAGIDCTQVKALDAYYQAPVRCLLRIRESVNFWEKKRGSDGYFSFIEDSMGASIPHDNKMNYAVMLGRS